MDVVMVDVQWQGFGAAKKVGDLAESYELNVAPQLQWPPVNLSELEPLRLGVEREDHGVGSRAHAPGATTR